MPKAIYEIAFVVAANSVDRALPVAAATAHVESCMHANKRGDDDDLSAARDRPRSSDRETENIFRSLGALG